jgi:hypothetical protein
MTIHKLHLHDRSRAVADWKCPRYRHLAYHAYGTGITSGTTSLELFMGTSIHDGMAAIATMTAGGLTVDIDMIADASRQQMLDALLPKVDGDPDSIEFAWEQSTLVEGLIRGFYKHAWPRLIAQYPRILFIEQEMEYPHDDMLFMSKPDLILSNEEGDEAIYLEYKSTASKREDWINSWDTAVQLHSTIRAVSASTGVQIERVIVQGLYKGYESYGKQSSPFCYAYKKTGQPPFVPDQVQYEYRYGFKRYPTWELPGGLKVWVASMPEEVLVNQFPQTPPIFINDELVNAFFRQRALREKEIATALDVLSTAEDPEHIQFVMDKSFPQRFDQCQPGWGKPCTFRKICHGNIPDPLKSGFAKREPHHVKELEQQEGQDEN